MIRLTRSRGQVTVEQALLFVLAAATLVGMFSYIRGALSHRLKSGADGIGQGVLY